ncbi:MAG TPA: imidazolonepropionase [Actinomycetota bacterium]|nr:imidazolonepropionase [Actinomycetota bacterium]
MSSLAIVDAAAVVPLAGAGPLRGPDLSSFETLEGASVTFEGDRVATVGDAADAEATFDARGLTVVPGFVDPHTHLPFFGWRADEDAARLAGVRYETLHREEGGIFRSARLLAEASDDDVLAFSEGLARSMLRNGTTTFETKSGYGLSLDAELRQLRLARQLADRVPQRVVSTCLAAHAVPRGRSEGEWIGQIAQELLPAVVEENLAEACDVYVETIAFSLEHAARLAHAAEQLQLRMRVHGDQLADNQTASFAARWGFASVDHLNHCSGGGVADLAETQTAAVLLPGATFTLRQEMRPPARALIDEGAVIALGTDLNPGTSPIHSMPFVMALACRTYGLRPKEALAASTVNAAFTLGLDQEVGRLQAGHRADAVVLDVPDVDELAYRPDAAVVAAVVCAGELVHVASGYEERAGRV